MQTNTYLKLDSEEQLSRFKHLESVKMASRFIHLLAFSYFIGQSFAKVANVVPQQIPSYLEVNLDITFFTLSFASGILNLVIELKKKHQMNRP